MKRILSLCCALAILLGAMLWMRPIELNWILSGSTLLLGLLGFADDFAKVAYRRRDGIPGKVKLLGQFLVAGAAVMWLFYLPDIGPYMRQFNIPFMQEPLFTGVWVAAIAVFAVVGASNAVNLTDGKDGLSTGCMNAQGCDEIGFPLDLPVPDVGDLLLDLILILQLVEDYGGMCTRYAYTAGDTVLGEIPGCVVDVAPVVGPVSVEEDQCFLFDAEGSHAKASVISSGYVRIFQLLSDNIGYWK